MTPSKVARPHCRAGLRSAVPVAPGTKVQCPRCGAPFTVAGAPYPVAEAYVASGTPRPAIPVQAAPRLAAVPARPTGPTLADGHAGGSTQPAVSSGGARKVLAGSLVCIAGLSLAGVAFLLLQYCFSSGTEAGPDRQAAGGGPPMEVDNLQPAVPAALKHAAPSLITLSPEEQQTVDEALARGVAYLKNTQSPDGSWPGDHRTGYTAMAALTLIECGMPLDEPCIKKATQIVRAACPALTSTYELSLALLFLNRLGDGADHDRIQALALRLAAGQQASGGWSYTCPVLSVEDQEKLLGLLQELKTSTPEDVRRAHSRAGGQVPPRAGRLAVLQDQPESASGIYRQGNADNSNTQFAILALWAARNHGLPLDRTLALLARRFRATQNGDGSWDYSPGHRVANTQGNPTMTCAGLLGLAVGHGLAAETDKTAPRPAQDPAIQKALHEVAKRIDWQPKAARRNKRAFTPDMYFLWSVERVAVLYQLKAIDGKEWFPWGMDQILKRQDGDGGWRDGGGHGATRTINTCFAMLFLKRVNLAKDLTDKIAEAVAALPPPASPARKQ